MFLNPWSLALVAVTIASIFFVLTTSYFAVRVVLLWDAKSDSEQQIKLEGEMWLSSTLTELVLVVQILSLVLAAENYATKE